MKKLLLALAIILTSALSFSQNCDKKKGCCKKIPSQETVIIPYSEDDKDAGYNFRVIVGRYKGDLPADFSKTLFANPKTIISDEDEEDVTTYWSAPLGTYDEMVKIKKTLIAKGFTNAKIVCIDHPLPK